MNKIIIDTKTLRDMLDQHPEAEVEILDVAKEKVAEELRRKLDPQKVADTLAEGLSPEALNARITAAIDQHVRAPYRSMLSQTVTSLIETAVKKFVDDAIKDEINKVAQVAAKSAYDEARKRFDLLTEDAVNRWVSERASTFIVAYVKNNLDKAMMAVLRDLATKPAMEG